MPGQVYLIQPEVLIGTNRFKIGLSKESNLKRLKSYGKGTRLIRIYECNNPKIVEKQLIKNFKEKFELIKGNEFFLGNEIEMIELFEKIYNQCTKKENVKKKVYSCKLCKNVSFKTHYALGGHCASIHPKKKSNQTKKEFIDEIFGFEEFDIAKDYNQITDNIDDEKTLIYWRNLPNQEIVNLIKNKYDRGMSIKEFIENFKFSNQKQDQIDLALLRENVINDPTGTDRYFIKRDNEINDQMKVDAKTMSTFNEFIKKYHYKKMDELMEKWCDYGGND